MIDVLNKSVEAKPQEKQERLERKKTYEILPEGTYNAKVLEIGSWRPMTKDVWVNKRDGAGRIVKDNKGVIQKELHKNLTFYNVDVTLEILTATFSPGTTRFLVATAITLLFIVSTVLKAPCVEVEKS